MERESLSRKRPGIDAKKLVFGSLSWSLVADQKNETSNWHCLGEVKPFSYIGPQPGPQPTPKNM
jgi:hypothetical protein